LEGFPNVFNPIIDHCKVPDVTTLMVRNVELVSPDNKHPLFTPCGFEVGLETQPTPKSTVFVAGFGGAIGKEGVEQADTASLQSFGCAQIPNELIHTYIHRERSFFIGFSFLNS
jgi:hypothetical protein